SPPLQMYSGPLLLQLLYSPENRLRLHRVNLRMTQAQAASAVPHQRIELVKNFHFVEQRFLVPQFLRIRFRIQPQAGHFGQQILQIGQKLVEGRSEERRVGKDSRSRWWICS